MNLIAHILTAILYFAIMAIVKIAFFLLKLGCKLVLMFAIWFVKRGFSMLMFLTINYLRWIIGYFFLFGAKSIIPAKVFFTLR